jgi:hypothetical protein
VSAISVIAGERYEASVYAAFHRCHGEMYLEFFDANGTWVGGGGFGVITDQPSGGRSLANFRRTGGFVTAPAGNHCSDHHPLRRADGRYFMV